MRYNQSPFCALETVTITYMNTKVTKIVVKSYPDCYLYQESAIRKQSLAYSQFLFAYVCVCLSVCMSVLKLRQFTDTLVASGVVVVFISFLIFWSFVVVILFCLFYRVDDINTTGYIGMAVVFQSSEKNRRMICKTYIKEKCIVFSEKDKCTFCKDISTIPNANVPRTLWSFGRKKDF